MEREGGEGYNGGFIHHITEHNRQHLAEWEEQLRHLQEEDERQVIRWRQW